MNTAASNSGFSLVEVMIAILILGVALVGLTQGLSTALGSTKESELQAAAALYAAGKIETLRAEGLLLDETTEGDCGEILPQCRWRQTVSAAEIEGLHEVDVVVEFSADGRLVFELRTLLYEAPGGTSGQQEGGATVMAGRNG